MEVIMKTARPTEVIWLTSKMLRNALLHDLNVHFQHILQPSSDNFNPLPAAATLLDPTVSTALVLVGPMQND